jgi:hypothetical protein
VTPRTKLYWHSIDCGFAPQSLRQRHTNCQSFTPPGAVTDRTRAGWLASLFTPLPQFSSCHSGLIAAITSLTMERVPLAVDASRMPFRPR